MASEKTEQPTEKRLRDVRKRGEVVISTDVTSTLVFIGVVTALWLLGPKVWDLQRELWMNTVNSVGSADPAQSITRLIQLASLVLMWTMIPLLAIVTVFGVAGAFSQVGGLMAWTRIKPDMKRLNPVEGFKRMFSTRNLINLAKMLIKTILLSVLMYVVVRSSLDTAVKTGYTDVFGVMSIAARLIMTVCAWAAVIYIVMAVFDYIHVRYEFMKQNRMSIDEVRREHKDTEGDPILIGRRRALQQEAIYASIMDRVQACSAIIYAQGFAIGIQYLGPDDLPRVIARGQGEVAAQIRRIANENLIPMEEDPHLAQRLYEEVMLDRPIPRHLYDRVAKLLRWATGKE